MSVRSSLPRHPVVLFLVIPLAIVAVSKNPDAAVTGLGNLIGTIADLFVWCAEGIGRMLAALAGQNGATP